MSNKKKNYSKMYPTEGEQAVVEAPVEETVETPVETVVEEKPVTKKKAKKLTGTVVNCAKLNVREHPDTSAAVLCVIPASSEVKVFAEEKFDEWVHVVTEDGVDGYCMKKYIMKKYIAIKQ